jgi:PPOX class probable FMN-dependent enzyme
VRTKKRDHLDDGLRAILGASPFLLLATADGHGRCDVSPRGGPPGFVKPIDDRHVAIPDLNGNNLLDSLRNIVTNPHAGLLVVVPGQHETLRIDGPAYLTDDDDVLDRFVDELRRPKLAVVVETAAVYTHCAKSFRRGRVWDPASWPTPERPMMLDARYRQLGLDATFEEYAAENESKIAAGLRDDAPV